jgi:hypothetical protein
MKNHFVRIATAFARFWTASAIFLCVATAAEFPNDQNINYTKGFPSYFSNNRTDTVSLASGTIDRWIVSVALNQVGSAGELSFTSSSIRLIASAQAGGEAATSLRITARCRTRIVATWVLGHWLYPTGTRTASYILRDELGLNAQEVVLASATSANRLEDMLDLVVEKGHSLELISSTAQGGSAALDVRDFVIREDDDQIGASAPVLSSSGDIYTIEYSTNRRNNVYVLEESTDLGTWTTVPSSEKHAASNENSLRWLRVADSSKLKMFWRVKLANQ